MKSSRIFYIILAPVWAAMLAAGPGCGGNGRELKLESAQDTLAEMAPATIDAELVEEILTFTSAYQYQSDLPDGMPGTDDALSMLFPIPSYAPPQGPPAAAGNAARAFLGSLRGRAARAPVLPMQNVYEDECIVYIDQSGGGEIDILIQAREGCVEEWSGCSYTGKVEAKGTYDLIGGTINFDGTIDNFGITCPDLTSFYGYEFEEIGEPAGEVSLVMNGFSRARGTIDTIEGSFDYWTEVEISIEQSVGDLEYRATFQTAMEYEGDQKEYTFSRFVILDIGGDVLPEDFVLFGETVSMWEEGRIVSGEGMAEVNSRGAYSGPGMAGAKVEFEFTGLTYDWDIFWGEYPVGGEVVLSGGNEARITIGYDATGVYYDWTLDGVGQDRGWIYYDFSWPPVEDPETAAEMGRVALSLGESGEARYYFGFVPPEHSLYGEAQYGMLFAEVQSVLAMVEDNLALIDMLYSMGASCAPVKPQQGDLWESMLVPMSGLDFMMDSLRNIRDIVPSVIENGWTFEMEDLPLTVGDEFTALFGSLILNGTHGELTARLIWLAADIALMVLDYEGAHAWDLNLSTMMGHLDDMMYMDPSVVDQVGLVRGLGWLTEENPGFWQKSVRWDSNMTEVKELMESIADNSQMLAGAVEATAVPGADGCGESICLLDLDGSATITAGDRLFVNAAFSFYIDAYYALGYELEPGLVSDLTAAGTLLEDYGIFLTATTWDVDVWADLASAAALETSGILVSILERALPAAGTLLDQMVASAGSPDAAVTFADLNPVLAAMGMPELPDAVSLNLSSFLDMPLGDLLTYYCVDDNVDPGECSVSTTAVLPVEVEMADVAAQCAEEAFCGPEPYPAYYLEGDQAHFVGTEYEVAADGLAPADSGDAELATDMLVYVGVADPTLNGSLRVNVNALPAKCGGHDAGGGSFSAPTLSDVNRVLNCVVVDYLPRLEASQFFLNAWPLLGPVVEVMRF